MNQNCPEAVLAVCMNVNCLVFEQSTYSGDCYQFRGLSREIRGQQFGLDNLISCRHGIAHTIFASKVLRC